MNLKPGMLKVAPGRAASASASSVDLLLNLKNQYGASCLKLSTEDAGMSFEQIDYWVKQCAETLPVMVKIGGPNARNDIKTLLNFNIKGFVAPMVESVYGLEDFIEALRDHTTEPRFKKLSKHINIETQTAIENLDAILNSSAIKELDCITLGRKDLSKSMKRSVGDPKVTELVKNTVCRIKDRNIKVSLGGGVASHTIDDHLHDIQPNQFNTRVVTFEFRAGQTYGPAVNEAIRFEMLILKEDLQKGFITPEEEKIRAGELRKRLDFSC
ncbi:MAG: aldolase/citrate lyase family protein [Nitrospinales bacterium]